MARNHRKTKNLGNNKSVDTYYKILNTKIRLIMICFAVSNICKRLVYDNYSTKGRRMFKGTDLLKCRIEKSKFNVDSNGLSMLSL